MKQFLFYIVLSLSLAGCSGFKFSASAPKELANAAAKQFAASHHALNQIGSGQVPDGKPEICYADDAKAIAMLISELEDNLKKFRELISEIVMTFPDQAERLKEAYLELEKLTKDMIDRLRNDADFQKQILDSIRKACEEKSRDKDVPVPTPPVPNDKYSKDVCDKLLREIESGQLTDEMVERLKADYEMHCQ